MSNEAAERLLAMYTEAANPWTHEQIKRALAGEGKATVERIRAALEEHDPDQAGYRIWAILDAEAAR